MAADITGMVWVRVIINLAIIHIPFVLCVFRPVRKWMFQERNGRVWDIVVYLLAWYHWVLFPVTHLDPHAFVFRDYGSWMENFTAYYLRDWGIRVLMEVNPIGGWLIGTVLLIAFTGVWFGDFYRSIRRNLKHEGWTRHLFLVPITLGTVAGIYLQLLPLKFPG